MIQIGDRFPVYVRGTHAIYYEVLAIVGETVYASTDAQIALSRASGDVPQMTGFNVGSLDLSTLISPAPAKKPKRSPRKKPRSRH